MRSSRRAGCEKQNPFRTASSPPFADWTLLISSCFTVGIGCEQYIRDIESSKGLEIS